MEFHADERLVSERREHKDEQEEGKMENTTQSVMTRSDAQAIETPHRVEANEGLHYYQGRILDELPGAAFAVITLVWVISCFFKLVW